MKSSTREILTTHAGSLPRPDDLIELNRARQDGETKDEAGYQQRLAAAEQDVVQRQKDCGITVPGDLSVVGYDDSPLMAFTDPPLTTMRQPVIAMAVAAVRALVDEIHGHAAPHSEYIFRPELVVRGSTAGAPHLAGQAAAKPRQPSPPLPLPV